MLPCENVLRIEIATRCITRPRDTPGAGSTSPTPALVDVLPENLTLSEAQVDYETHSHETALRIARIIKRTPDAQLIANADKLEKLDKIARKALKLEVDKPQSAINIKLLANGNLPRLVIKSGEPAAEPPALVEDRGLKPADEPLPNAA